MDSIPPSPHNNKPTTTSSSFKAVDDLNLDAAAAPETHQPSAPADSNPSDDDAALNIHNNDNIDDEEEEEEKSSINVDADDAEAATTLPHVSGSIDKFLQHLSASPDPLPEVPSSTVETFSGMVEEVIAMYDSGKVRFGQGAEEDSSLIHAVTRISALTNAIRNLPSSTNGTGSHSQTASSLDRASRVLHRAMSFFEEEFRALLEDLSSSSINNKGGGVEHRDDDGGNNNTNTSNTRRALLTTNSAKATSTPKTKQSSSFNNNNNNNNNSSNKSNCCVLPEVDSGSGSEKADEFAGYSAEAISRMNRIAEVMILTGYETECCQVYSIARRHAFEQALNRHGFEKISIEDVQRMQWDALNGEIFTWTKVVAHCTTKLFPGERNICQAVFAGHHPPIFRGLFTNLARAVVIQLLAFAEAVAMTKRSAEKLFRFLDMYETLRDLLPAIDEDDDETSTTKNTNAEEEEEEDTPTPDCYYSTHELKSEIAAAGGRLGEAAVGNFCDLENSIKSDTGKTPVPSGALHPLTSYTMNYLRYACEYKDTLEQVFLQHHQKLLMEGGGGEEEDKILMEGEDINNCCSHNNNNNRSNKDSITTAGAGGGSGSSAEKKTPTPFSVELMRVMDLLDANLEAKSRLYRDPSLRYIFLMNNGRYIMQKIRGSTGLHELMGDTWRRNRSSDLRQYHKMFQRETWVRVLGILKDDGLTVNGKVSKVALKERFKTFNALFEEIHRTQSTWVVSDEQLQSELRVSISAIVIPAYRSFLGRFRHYLDSGRQSHKYIKFQPEDIEAAIEELFEGNPMSMARRRN